jgi:hypothetical protein
MAKAEQYLSLQLNPSELEIFAHRSPNSEPTDEELKALENISHSVPSRREMLLSTLSDWDKPKSKIIINEEINEIGNYKRIIFNDGETIQQLDWPYTTPKRVEKRNHIIKLKSEIKELTQDIKFARQQMERLPQSPTNAHNRIKIRNYIREELKHRSLMFRQLDKLSPRYY